MSSRPPPQAPPLFNYSPDSLIRRVEDLIACNKELTDTVVQNVSVDKAEFSNVLIPLAHGKNIMPLEMNVIGFLGSVSSDSNIRNAVTLAQKKKSNYDVESSMREDVFKLVEAVYHKQKDDLMLDAESRFLLEKEYKAYVRMGLGLPHLKQNRLKEIKKRLPELYIAFSKNLSEEKGGIWFSPEELNGVPDDVLQTLAKGQSGSENEGMLRLTFKYPDLHPVQRYCTVAETRKKVFLANENKCNENIPLLREALALRDEAARLLGYADHATFVLEDRMAKTPETVNEFLDDLRKRLGTGAEKELEKLKELKRTDTGQIHSDDYYLWDQSYYHTLMLLRDYQLDQNKIAEYFPLPTCIAGMLNIFEEICGLVFVKVDGKDRDTIAETGKGDDIVWHPDVQLFSVWNDAEDEENSSFIGYLYFDLHPREGKFGHAANYTLQPGFITKDSNKRRRYPATALVCNFTKPTAEKPSLLKHNEVVTMFHELGHGIHNLVSRTTYACFHGTNTTRDFVEAPSQMLENWCWNSSQIKALSKHWSFLSPEYEKAYMNSTTNARPEEKMPDAMIQSIIRTRYINDALANLRLLHYSIFDMVVHQPKSHEEIIHLDISRLFNKLRREICMLDGNTEKDDWANGAAILGHIMGGYDAGIYGYLLSEVYATDMFHAFFKEDLMNKEAGRRYRSVVLEYGGSREPMELLRVFLGREPSTEAFYKQLGID